MDNVKLRWRPIEFPGAVVSTSDVPLELPFNDNSVWVDLGLSQDSNKPAVDSDVKDGKQYLSLIHI